MFTSSFVCVLCVFPHEQGVLLFAKMSALSDEAIVHFIYHSIMEQSHLTSPRLLHSLPRISVSSYCTQELFPLDCSLSLTHSATPTLLHSSLQMHSSTRSGSRAAVPVSDVLSSWVMWVLWLIHQSRHKTNFNAEGKGPNFSSAQLQHPH